MSRLLGALRTDITLQARNRLYWISVLFAATLVGALVWLSSPESLHRTVPMAVLFVVGGSTLLYAVALILLEREGGTLSAVSVSPLRPWEYLAAKIASLTLLATLEGVLLVGGAAVWLGAEPSAIGWPSLLAGLLGLGAFHSLVGIIVVVRYDRIMEALIPMGVAATVLQVPAFHFVGALPSPLALAIPSAPPAIFVQAAFTAVAPWRWAYAIVGSAAVIGGAALWAHRAFVFHVAHGGVR